MKSDFIYCRVSSKKNKEDIDTLEEIQWLRDEINWNPEKLKLLTK